MVHRLGLLLHTSMAVLAQQVCWCLPLLRSPTLARLAPSCLTQTFLCLQALVFLWRRHRRCRRTMRLHLHHRRKSLPRHRCQRHQDQQQHPHLRLRLPLCRQLQQGSVFVTLAMPLAAGQ